MGFRYRKSFRVAPGVRVNLGSKSAGVSAGGRGARVGFNTRTGAYTSVGIPGTGLSYHTRLGGSQRSAPSRSAALPVPALALPNPLVVPVPISYLGGAGCLGMLLAVFCLFIHPILALLVLAGGFAAGYALDQTNAEERRKAAQTNEAANRAWAALLSGEAGAARGDLELLLRETPDNPHVWYALATALLDGNEGDWRRGRDLARRLVDSGYDINGSGWILLGQHLFKLSDWRGAERAFHSAQERAGDEATRESYALGRALAVMEGGQASLALEILRTINLRRKWQDEFVCTVRFYRGECLRQMGQCAAARKEWERVAAIDPNFEDVQQLLNLL